MMKHNLRLGSIPELVQSYIMFKEVRDLYIKFKLTNAHCASMVVTKSYINKENYR